MLVNCNSEEENEEEEEEKVGVIFTYPEYEVIMCEGDRGKGGWIKGGDVGCGGIGAVKERDGAWTVLFTYSEHEVIVGFCIEFVEASSHGKCKLHQITKMRPFSCNLKQWEECLLSHLNKGKVNIL